MKLRLVAHVYLPCTWPRQPANDLRRRRQTPGTRCARGTRQVRRRRRCQQGCESTGGECLFGRVWYSHVRGRVASGRADGSGSPGRRGHGVGGPQLEGDPVSQHPWAGKQVKQVQVGEIWQGVRDVAVVCRQQDPVADPDGLLGVTSVAEHPQVIGNGLIQACDVGYCFAPGTTGRRRADATRQEHVLELPQRHDSPPCAG